MTESSYEGNNRVKVILDIVGLLLANPDQDLEFELGHVTLVKGTIGGQEAELEDSTLNIGGESLRHITLGTNIGSVDEPLMKVYIYKPWTHELNLRYSTHDFDGRLNQEEISAAIDSHELQHNLGLNEADLSDWEGFIEGLQKFIPSSPQ